MSVLTLNVDEVMRTLSAESTNPFVVHDKEVDIVRFAINSGFADIVLDGQVALRVMYQRPGESQVRAQTLTYYDTDGLHNYYDWQLSQSDLAKNGSLMVALCILDISGGEVSEWHTTPCAVRVLPTIHTDDSDEGDAEVTPTVKERVAVLETMIQRVASGAPIVVSSASAMTDTEQIYVLSTDGNWYYHNGTAWVAGGEYGGVLAGSITTDKLANKSVTTAKLDDSSVTWQKLASGAVHTGELADSAVTNIKLADSSVSEGKLASGAVTTAKIADGAITADKLSSDIDFNVETDTTLTQSGIPADAKTVGDEVADLKDDFSNIADTVYVISKNLLNFNDPDFVINQKLSETYGYPVASSGVNTTGFIAVEEGKTYNLEYGTSISTSQMISRVCAYDENKAYLSSYTQNGKRGFTVPVNSGIAYIRLSQNGTYLNSEVQNVMITDGIPDRYYPYFDPYYKTTVKNTALDMDAVPTIESTKPVQSGGIYTALQEKQETLSFDDTPTSGSNNPVKSGGIYDAIAPVSNVINTELIVSKNLLNLNDPDVVLNKSINATTGLPSGTANGLTVTGFIPITADETYAIYYMDSFVQGIELKRVCYYNADKEYIENGCVNNVRRFTPPTGCSFVRIVANTTNISVEKHGMLCVVGTASEYIPYFNPYNKYTVKNTALDTDYIRTFGGVEQVFPEWELGSYDNSWGFTDSTTTIMSDYIAVGDHLKITVAEGYAAKVYPFYLTGKRGATHPINVTNEIVISKTDASRFVRITLVKTTEETVTDPNTYGLNVTIVRYGEQVVFDTQMSATPNAQDVIPGEVLPQYLALVAVKEKNVLGELPVTVGYLYRTVTVPYKLYYAQGKPDNIRYLCDWNLSIAGESHNTPIWYCFGITDEGDIICVHRGEIESTSPRVRDNPIVYPHTDYANPVLVELTGTKPTSWISNSGDYAESGHFFFGEYIRDGHTEANVWDVSAPYTQATNWQIIKTYERDANPSDMSSMVLGKIEHIHHVSRDPFSGVFYVTTGDHYTEARIDYLKDGVWGILAEADEEICRQLNFVYTPTYVYWASDAFSIYDPETQQMVGGSHKFFRAKRDSNGLIDIDGIERYDIPYLDGSIATYHVSYVKDPECILILDRQDYSKAYTELPFHVWNIKQERLEYAGQCKTAKGNVAQFLGFRCECCQHYPNLYNNILSVGFSLYPNSIDVCGNPNPNIIPSQGGNTSIDSVNKNQVNSMTLEVVKH